MRRSLLAPEGTVRSEAPSQSVTAKYSKDILERHREEKMESHCGNRVDSGDRIGSDSGVAV